jgi:hypothetical protein
MIAGQMGDCTASYDVFVSYAHSDREQVAGLVAAIERQGCGVWWDSAEVFPFTSITQSILNGISASKVVLGWYSLKYPLQRPCQLELATAFLQAQTGGDPRDRMLRIPG